MHNVDKPAIRVRHAALERVSEDSDFKSVCPVCEDGILLMHRDKDHGFKLKAVDTCMSCGQMFIYIDIDELNYKEA